MAQARVALTDEQKSEKKAEKKKAKKERKDNPSPIVPASPGPKARAKSKGKHQLRIMLEGDSETKDTADWEDETHVYAFVEADMVYDEEDWFFDPVSQEWYAEYTYPQEWE